MRRIAAITLASLLASVALSTSALAESDHGDYRDDFKNTSYAGDDGSLDWGGPWIEVGESDGPDTGAVYVMDDALCAGNKCLHIHSSGLLNQVGARRHANTSVFEEATLSYYLDAEVVLDATLRVEVSENGNSNWDTIDTVTILALGDYSGERFLSLEGYLVEAFGVRFVVSGLLGGEVYIDNVVIEGDFVATTTTTSEPATTTTTTTMPPTTTTTTKPPTTTTTRPTTTTTRPATTTSEDDSPQPTESPASTTTTVGGDTDDGLTVPVGATPPSGGSGLRFPDMGVQADFGNRVSVDGGLRTPEVLALTVDYRMAAETIAANWVWLVILLLVITSAIVAGLDRKGHLPGFGRRTGTTGLEGLAETV